MMTQTQDSDRGTPVTTRRLLLTSAAGAVASAAVPRLSRAGGPAPERGETTSWPSRPVHIVVGFAAGGATDVVARLIGQWLSDRLGQSFIVENRTGGNSNIATEAVVNAPADGHVLLMAGTANVVNTTLYGRLGFVFDRDIAPVACIGEVPAVLEVNPAVPVTTVPEFIAWARDHRLSMGSGGLGSPQHIAGELFKMMTGVDLVPVHYRGGAPAIADLLGGQVQVGFDILLEAVEHIRAGKLRPLAVTTAARAPLLPEVPAMNEYLAGYEASFWWGIGAPRGTPAAVIAKLNAEINAALADPGVQARVTALAATVRPGSPQDFGALIARDTEKWGRVVRAANLKVE